LIQEKKEINKIIRIICNIGSAGRTGHDYNDRFRGDELIWHGKTRSHINQPTIQQIIDPKNRVFVFSRDDNRADFTFAGLAYPKKIEDTIPVGITWVFDMFPEDHPEVLPNEIPEKDIKSIYEGAKKTITVNVYERNPLARKKCIEYWGCVCLVCGFDFSEYYGELGEGFIHVHHI